MGTKSRESIYGSSIRASAERAAAARKEADKLACEEGTSAWKRSSNPRPQPGQAPNSWPQHLTDVRDDQRIDEDAQENQNFLLHLAGHGRALSDNRPRRTFWVADDPLPQGTLILNDGLAIARQ
jgi:hypothetical protein